MTYYVRQVKTFELGNFINCTPTIQALYKQYKRPVPVLFENEYLADVFKDAPFMMEIFKPGGRELFSSKMVNSDIPDWQFIYNNVAQKIGGLPETIPHTYIDSPLNNKSDFVVVVRGCLQAWKFSTKDPGDPAYYYLIKHLIDLGHQVVFVGQESDVSYSQKVFKYFGKALKYSKTTLREAVGLVNSCDFIVGNDTGLMHAAAALKKKAFCMWAKTIFEKNRTPGDYVTYSFNNYINDFKKWISALP